MHDEPVDRYDAQTLTTSVQTAILGAVAIPSGGAPVIEGIIPLLLDDSPAFTIAYNRLETARMIRRNPELTLALHDPRLARIGWSPLAVPVRATVEPDPEGDIFRERLLEYELRKHPPSREIISTFLLQRENWWYLPRLIVRLEPAETPHPLTRREDTTHGLLAWEDGSGGHPAVQTAAAPDTSDERVTVRPLGVGGPPDGAPASLRLHDLEIPEMERSATLNLSGRLRGGTLAVETRAGSAGLGPRPGIISRLRWFRALERGCKRGLKTGY
ncbi:hypothetical protein [Rubrobacter aplysinae]|uniref:hypothetical protein n=1 Tax=Rubrobacter aplysinae TaxID=909625 RepID=UPI00069F90AA|nr:hypothetical protein [Rubrobacter aplysinae]